MTDEHQYISVPVEARPTKRASAHHPSAISLKLEAGETLFFPGLTWKNQPVSRGKGTYLQQQGFRVLTRSGKFKGKDGLFVWVEKIEE
jgi:hypothetical protein